MAGQERTGHPSNQEADWEPSVTLWLFSPLLHPPLQANVLSPFPYLRFERGNRPFLLTVVAVVVHQDDFFEQVSRGVIDSRVDGAQDHRQSLVDEDEDEGDLGEVSRVTDLSASVQRHANNATPSVTQEPFHARL